MMKFNENADKMQATAYAVIMGIADQFLYGEFTNEFTRNSLHMNYTLLSPNERRFVDDTARRALEQIELRDTSDLLCDISCYRDAQENIYATFRTGIEDYGLTMNTDGIGWFGRIKAA